MDRRWQDGEAAGRRFARAVIDHGKARRRGEVLGPAPCRPRCPYPPSSRHSAAFHWLDGFRTGERREAVDHETNERGS